jgi:predicted  nucleic acid-binding Zn-ribbon protein
MVLGGDMMDRLLREGNPPPGQLASPKPQYKDVQTNSWEELKGEGGASYVKDKDALAKLEQARVLLNAISGKDFATQTTLAAVLAKLADLESKLATIKANQLSGDQKVTLSGINAELEALMQGFATEDKLEQVRQLLTGVATENKLEQARTLLEAISTKDFATQTTLAAVLAKLGQLETEIQAVKANQLSGNQKVQLSGTKVVESAPVTGIKTVTSTVAEVFAGSSRKANRSKLVIRNLHRAVAIRIGGSGITDTIGQSLEPGASVEIDFSPSTTVPIYAVSTAGNVSVEVLEV